jgi:endonuclease/exonuclease/phosphatase family metal-dependent hydrolase
MDEVEAGSFSSRPAPEDWPDSIRVVSWNVARGIQLNGIIGFLGELSADLIMLQETDVGAGRTQHRNIPREIARALELNYVFGREFQELSQGRGSLPAYHGQATLSRFPLSQARVLRFRRQSTFWQPRWFIPRAQIFQRRLGGRMALITEITIRQRTLALFNGHLESRGSDQLRTQQLSEICEEIAGYAPQSCVILAGDFNFDVSKGKTAALVSDMLWDNPFASIAGRRTTEARRRSERRAIDWILTGKALSGTNPEIHNSVDASDHYPLSLKVSFPLRERSDFSVMNGHGDQHQGSE